MYTMLYYAVPNTYYSTVPLEGDIILEYTLYYAVPNTYCSTVPLERDIIL